jgi:ribosome-associated heat shock protein Hsp15
MSSPDDRIPPAASRTQRLDKWLWFARITKSRTLAVGLITGGKIRVNRLKTLKPSQLVKSGDVITCAARKGVRVLRVRAPGHRRGPAAEANALYEELTLVGETQSLINLPGNAGLLPAGGFAQGGRPHGAGRPTKRERRKIGQLKGKPS